MTSMHEGLGSIPKRGEDQIDVLASSLLDAFGPLVCEVIERQIEEADGDAEATWLELWHRLCGGQARRA